MEKEKTKLELTIGTTTTSYESPHTDLDISDILEGLVGMLVAHTFVYENIIESMEEYSLEHKIDKEDD